MKFWCRLMSLENDTDSYKPQLTHFLLLFLCFPFTFQQIDYLQHDYLIRFCFHLGSEAYTNTAALRVSLNYYCLNIRYDPFCVLAGAH